MSTATQEWPRRHRITVDKFYRMADAGLFAEDERVELIDGEIIDMPPMGARHAGTLHHLAALLAPAFGTDRWIRQQLPLRLERYSEPVPDIAVVTARADYYKDRHPAPADALLVVEVAEATLRYDREVKAALYARHGVREYWVVDCEARVVHRYREPKSSGYSRIEVVAFGPIDIWVPGGGTVDLTPL
jgi:Uma2 family endonuclease